MPEAELWEYFWSKKIAHAKPLDRDFIWISIYDFDAVKDSFVTEYNLIQTGPSYRSRGYLSHIHAVVQGKEVFIHMDYGNVARFLPLGLLHLFADVIPYMIFASVKRVPLKSVFKLPE